MDTRKKFAILIQNYFCQYLINQKRVSDRTVQCYRDTFCLLFKFIETKTGKDATQLSLEDLNADLILKFLNHLESIRHNSIASRNIRLAAIRSFLNYASYQDPDALQTIQRVLAIPMKRHDRKLIGFLTKDEIDAILNSIDTSTWSGQRDHALLATLYNTGARVSEIISIKRSDIELNDYTTILLHGKGRKERSVPLWKSTSVLLKKWVKEINEDAQTPLFPNHFGNKITRAGIENRINVCVENAARTCDSLVGKKISPHVIRHTTAMHLLQSGIDLSVIALWLGHENINTTHKYMESDLQMKEKILNAIEDPKHKIKNKKLPDNLITFLRSL